MFVGEMSVEEILAGEMSADKMLVVSGKYVFTSRWWISVCALAVHISVCRLDVCILNSCKQELVGDMSEVHTSLSDMSIDSMSVGDMSVDEMSVGDMSVDDTSVGDMSVDDTSVDER